MSGRTNSDEVAEGIADAKTEVKSLGGEAHVARKRSCDATSSSCDCKTRRIETSESYSKRGRSGVDENGALSLHWAAENGDAELVKKISNFGAFASGKDRWCRTLLHTSARENQLEMAESLLDRGADVNAANENGCTPLYLANDVQMVKLLLSRGACVHGKNRTSTTPLHRAVTKQKLEIVKLLLHHGAEVDARDAFGFTPLYLAISDAADAEIIEALLSKGACVNDRSEWGWTVLHQAVLKQKSENVKLLLDWKADANAADRDGDIPLHCAAFHADAKIVEMLLTHGACVDAKSHWGRCSEADDQKPACASTEIGRTPLHLAVANKYLENVKLLLAWGADVNAEDRNGESPLHLAVKRGYIRIVAVLKKQVVKLRVASLFVSSKNMHSVGKDDVASFRCTCEEEVGRMKKATYCDGVSFFDVLTKNVDHLAVYARNLSIVQDLESDGCETRFPMYARMMKRHFKFGIERKGLLDQGYEIFDRRPDFRELPLSCASKILTYLSNEDLKKCYKIARNEV